VKINPSEPPRQALPSQPAVPPSAPVASLGGDRLLVSRPANDTPAEPLGFSWRAAGGHWWRGFIRQPLAVVAGVRAHPWRSLAIAAAGGAAILLVPVVLPISLTTLGTTLAVGFGAWGALNMAGGALAARRDYRNGKYDEAEKDFGRIGEGSFNLASAAAPYVGRQVLGLLRSEVTSEAAYAGRLTEGAKIVSKKAEGLERAASTATKAGETSEAESLIAAAKQLKTYEQTLKDQSTALKTGKQTIAGARQEVQKATQTMQAQAPRPDATAIRLGNTAAEKTWFQKLRGAAVRRFHQVRTDKGVAHRAQAAQRALGLRRMLKILQPFIGVVPSTPIPDESSKP
jgi:hypothetical protein